MHAAPQLQRFDCLETFRSFLVILHMLAAYPSKRLNSFLLVFWALVPPFSAKCRLIRMSYLAVVYKIV
jgi:hypothetical protein